MSIYLQVSQYSKWGEKCLLQAYFEGFIRLQTDLPICSPKVETISESTQQSDTNKETHTHAKNKK